MDVIIIGVYQDTDKKTINNIISNNANLEIEWNYNKYVLESSRGIDLFKETYKLSSIGILTKKDEDNIPFTSYPLIDEITTTHLGGTSSEPPELFNFLDSLESSNIKKMIVAFADEWDEKSYVRIEQHNIEDLKQRLNTVYVWCDSYFILPSKTGIRVDYYPLIIEIGNKKKGNYSILP